MRWRENEEERREGLSVLRLRVAFYFDSACMWGNPFDLIAWKLLRCQLNVKIKMYKMYII